MHMGGASYHATAGPRFPDVPIHGPKDPARVSWEELDSEAIDACLGFLVGPDAIARSHKDTCSPFRPISSPVA